MTDAAIIKATFSEWRMVKGRKVLQLVCEVPLEAQDEVWKALGTPMPDTDTWVAIARLKSPAQIDASANDDVIEVRDHRPLSQVAAILGGLPPFRRWLEETGEGDPIIGPSEAASEIKRRCGIQSRKELDTNEIAARHFRNIRTDYNNWMRDAA